MCLLLVNNFNVLFAVIQIYFKILLYSLISSELQDLFSVTLLLRLNINFVF